MLQFLARVNAFFSQILGRAKAFLSDVREFAGRKRKQRAEEAAYYAWERAGRPELTREERDWMYFEAFEKLRPRWLWLRWLYAGYCVVAFSLLMGLLCLSHVDQDRRIPGWWPLRIMWSLLVLLLLIEVILTIRIFSAFRLSAIRKTPPVTTTSEHLQLPGARKMLFRRLFSSSPSLSAFSSSPLGA